MTGGDSVSYCSGKSKRAKAASSAGVTAGFVRGETNCSNNLGAPQHFQFLAEDGNQWIGFRFRYWNQYDCWFGGCCQINSCHYRHGFQILRDVLEDAEVE